MKASEVLNRYATGERDFRRTDLRGQSFKGQDLSGADFSEADIRGTNFTNTILKGANFTKAKAGVQRRWWLVQQGIAFVLSALSSFLSAFAGVIIAALLFTRSNNLSVVMSREKSQCRKLHVRPIPPFVAWQING
jgi:hypothetical protein